MGIGEFAQSGQFGKFSVQELMFLQQLSEAGFKNSIESTYPGVTSLFATQEEGGAEGADRGSSIDSFVGDVAGSPPSDQGSLRMAGIQQPSFLEGLVGLPAELSSGIRPAGERFDFDTQFGPEGVLGFGEQFQAQRDLGRGGIGEVLKGESELTDFIALKALDTVKAVGQGAVRHGIDAVAPGSSLVLSNLFPDFFGKSPIQAVCGS